jgi:hypothetical protein
MRRFFCVIGPRRPRWSNQQAADKTPAMHPARTLLVALMAAAMLTAAAPAWPQGMPDAPRADIPTGYQRALQRYLLARQAYEQDAHGYWHDIAEKRKLRNARRRKHEAIGLGDYVLTQPPVYTGPPEPKNPLPQPPQPPGPAQPAIPVVADFLRAAQEQWGFVPRLPQSEEEFKRAYALAARAAGLSQAQVVGVYAFETGGNGDYDTQAGVTPKRPRAISPALGYNQLLSTNTISLLAEHGGIFLAALERKARTLNGETRVQLERKIAALRRMIAFCRGIPQRWSDYDRIAKHTAKGWGIHAAVLDIDIGPLLQVQNLLNSVRFARVKGFDGTLSAAELELMNLTGDGNGIDMVLMPQDLRERVPTANFFQPNGYARNPVARRTKVVAGLIAEIQNTMNRNAQGPGARELAAAF